MTTPTTRLEDYDEERQRFFILTAVLFWSLVLLFYVARDPVWRVLYEGNLIAPPQRQASGWTELDGRLIDQMAGEVERHSGVTDLEQAITSAINGRRSAASIDEQPLGEAASPERLRDLARVLAYSRLQRESAEEVDGIALRFPIIFLSLAQPARLVRAVEVHQLLSSSYVAPGFADELVGGWMNRRRVRDMVLQTEQLEVGVGAVSADAGRVSVQVVLQRVIAELDVPLPAVIDEDAAPLKVSGRRADTTQKVAQGSSLQGDKEEPSMGLFFKGPADPGFYPHELQWEGGVFRCTLMCQQGKGSYAIRAGTQTELSDPRPIVVR